MATLTGNSKAILKYKQAGVDIAASEKLAKKIQLLSKATTKFNNLNKADDFAGLFDITSLNYKHPILASSCDGVGTKLRLAIKANFYNNIGIDLVAMCVNDLLTKGAEPLFLLDYFAMSNFNEKRDNAIMQSIIDGCKQANCSLLGGETAQMPQLYNEHDFDLAGFALGIVEKENILPKSNLKKGDYIIGLKSNGLHANGFSLIHHLIEKKQLDIFSKASFDANLSYAEIFLKATKIYTKQVLQALKRFKGIKAIAHITGGGFIQNLPRILPINLCALLNLEKFPYDPLFEWLAQKLKFDSSEMLQIFNCGIGLVLILEAEQALTICEYFNENSFIIGELIEEKDKIKIYSTLNGIE